MYIRIVLVIVLLVIIYQLVAPIKSNESFSTPPKCEFMPWGPSKRACIDRCRVDRDLWGGDACTLAKCYEICTSCSDIKKCKWLNTRDFLEEKRQDYQTNPDVSFNLEIRAIEGDQSAIVQYIHDPNLVDSYVLQYYQSAFPNAGVKVFNINQPSEGLNTISLKNLKNNTTYSIVVIPLKNKKKMNHSNTVSVTPRNYLDLKSYVSD